MARHSINMERRDKATLMGVLTTMAHSQQGPKYRVDNALSIDNLANTANVEAKNYRRYYSHETHSLATIEPVQVKVIEMLLFGMSPITITKSMQLEPGQVRFYQQQSAFRTAFWRAFLQKMLAFVRRLTSILKNLNTDTQISSKYSLWLTRWWLARFSTVVEYQDPPNIPVLQSEIMHLLLLGMTRKEVSNALMIDPKQIDEYRQRPAFRVTFWCAYCHKLLSLVSKSTAITQALLANHQIAPYYRFIAIAYILEKSPSNFTHILERMELEQMACVLTTIGAGQLSCASVPL
jgi:hypothetical protein